jgi:cyanophycinase-like exopeptidase
VDRSSLPLYPGRSSAATAAVDVHAAQWGTLSRLCAAVSGGLVSGGIAIDEDPAAVVSGDSAVVAGLGAAHVVIPAPDAVVVSSISVPGVSSPSVSFLARRLCAGPLLQL